MNKKKKNIMLLQQGDVLLERVKKLPTFCIKVTKDLRGYVFAEGEATGHYHAVKNTKDCQLYNADGSLFFENKVAVKIDHQEHETIEIPAGFWKVGIVKEYDHFSEETREVID